MNALVFNGATYYPDAAGRCGCYAPPLDSSSVESDFTCPAPLKCFAISLIFERNRDSVGTTGGTFEGFAQHLSMRVAALQFKTGEPIDVPILSPRLIVRIHRASVVTETIVEGGMYRLDAIIGRADRVDVISDRPSLGLAGRVHFNQDSSNANMLHLEVFTQRILEAEHTLIARRQGGRVLVAIATPEGFVRDIICCVFFSTVLFWSASNLSVW